jgi:hypothetical protein
MGPVDNPIWTAQYHDLELKDDSFAPIVMKIMAEKPKDIMPEEARLKEIAILEQRDRLLQQRDALLQRLAVLYGEEAGRDPSTASSVSMNPEASSSGLANLPLTDAILEYLKTCKGPKAPHQIWAALEAAGNRI